MVVDLCFPTSPRSERSGQSSVGLASAKNAMFAKMKKAGAAPMPSPLGSFSAPAAGPGTAAGSVTAAAAAAAAAAVNAATAVAAVSVSPPRVSNNYDDWDDEDNDLQVLVVANVTVCARSSQACRRLFSHSCPPFSLVACCISSLWLWSLTLFYATSRRCGC